MRRVEPGINWVWYYTDTKEEGEKWYEENSRNGANRTTREAVSRSK